MGTTSSKDKGGSTDRHAASAAKRIEAEPVPITNADVDSHIDLTLPGQTMEQRLTQHDFHILKVIGKGSFGKVLLVTKKDSSQLYAMKVLKKDALIKRNQVQHTKAERRILRTCDSPFIVRMHYAFQTAEKLFLVLDYLPGGELFYHLKRERRFVEERVQLYAAELVLALEHLHGRDIVYRDLKPENVLLDADGHVCLTDFGLSKDAITADGRTRTFCGTPEYIAPEILQGLGHGKPVDWWSLGTLVYEMLVGLPPFYSTDVNTMYEKILKSDLTFPAYISPPARDILAALLKRSPDQRLGGGATDAAEIKAHPWFASLDWQMVAQRKYTPIYQPVLAGCGDTSHFDQAFTDLPIESLPTDASRPGTSHAQPGGMMFEGFSWDGSANGAGLPPPPPPPGGQA